MKSENKNLFTIMFVPADGEKNIRRFHISQLLVNRIKKVAIAISSVFALFFGHYIYLFADQFSHSENSAESGKVSQAMIAFSQKLDQSQSQLEHLEQIQDKLKHLAQLSDPNRNLAIGPVTDDRDSSDLALVKNDFLYKVFKEHTLVIQTKISEQSVTNFQMAVSNHVQSMNELLDTYHSRLDLLSHTPAISPSEGWISSTFGYRSDPYTQSKEFHSGLDIAGNVGTPIVAPADGKVSFVGQQNAYGKLITIDHGMGLITRYGHLSSTVVSVGQKIERGDLIGSMGNSGRSTGPHLHYEVLLNGLPQNPQNYILN